jgi:hypothetical protein
MPASLVTLSSGAIGDGADGVGKLEGAAGS